ncbi:hypothetical protein PpBr36_09002 [Pyricularia pennisetigena]|uniref:hypothetical protein n=1 Tax=Pyricularia pennisetigena TaxID=1578925 RepID=UPI00115083FB|nr:hypothetical protein PpBr36_09002 [Pyricularia pennisetigena]TLS24671.1 hypothetical protein PpBr36_09002 [Pyricularia pennisetigena]
MHSRAVCSVVRGTHGLPARAASTSTSIAWPGVIPTSRAFSTTPNRWSSDEQGGDKPSDPRNRSRAAADSLGDLAGPSSANGSDSAAPSKPSFSAFKTSETIANVRTIPRPNAGLAGSGGPKPVHVVKAPSFLGRGRGRGGFVRLGEGRLPVPPGGRFPGTGVTSPSTSRGGRGGGAALGSPMDRIVISGGVRGGRGGRGARGARGRGQGGSRGGENKEKAKLTPEEAEICKKLDARYDRLNAGTAGIYTPSTSVESLKGWRPAVPTSTGSAGMVEGAIRAMRVLGGGQAFNTESGPNHPRDTEHRYHSEKPIFFSDPKERDYLIQETHLRSIRGPGEETKEAIMSAVVRGEYEGPKFADMTQVMPTLAMFHRQNSTYKASDAQRFADKVASLLPGAPRPAPGKQPKA